MARVAQALNVTQPASSKQINELEEIVAQPIVTRDRNRLFLTLIGARLADHARAVLAQIDRAAFDIEAMASGVSGSVQVGAVSSVAPGLLPGAIALFKFSAPQSSVSITEGHFVSLYPLLESGQIDLPIARVWHPTEIAEVAQAVLFEEPIVAVTGRDHALAHQERVTWAQAATCAWTLPQANSVARRAVDAMFAGHGLVPPTNVVASSSLSLNLEVLSQMPALGLFPRSQANAHAARGDLVILPLDTAGLLSQARCFWKPEAVETKGSVDLFRRCLLQVARGKTIPFG